MNFIEIEANKLNDLKAQAALRKFSDLIETLKQWELPPNQITFVNEKISEINQSTKSGNNLSYFIKAKQGNIFTKLEKELKIVPKNYYRNLWLILGMSAFGLPIGVVFGLSMGNMGLLGLGLPIGLGIGTLVGSKLDEKAKAEGRQLNFE